MVDEACRRRCKIIIIKTDCKHIYIEYVDDNHFFFYIFFTGWNSINIWIAYTLKSSKIHYFLANKTYLRIILSKLFNTENDWKHVRICNRLDSDFVFVDKEY